MRDIYNKIGIFFLHFGFTYSILHITLYYLISGTFALDLPFDTGINGNQARNIILVSILSFLLLKETKYSNPNFKIAGMITGIFVFVFGIILHL